MIRKIAAYGSLVALGIGGTTAYNKIMDARQDYRIVEKENKTYLFDKLTRSEIELHRTNNLPQLGDKVYRLEGLLVEEKTKKNECE